MFALSKYICTGKTMSNRKKTKNHAQQLSSVLRIICRTKNAEMAWRWKIVESLSGYNK